MFTITTEPRRRLVRITISGMLTVDQVRELYRQEHEAIRAMDCPLGEQVCIADVSECSLQLQDIVAAFQKSMDSPDKARRLALVTGNSPARMQVRRIMQRDDAALFHTVAEAETWLFGQPMARAA